ncbi:MAG: hypothetical protein ACI4T1_01555 [Christensenellales bacterium]
MDKKLTENELFKLNPFKERYFNSNYRACVGNNSGVSPNFRDCIIIDGYKASVEKLYQDMIEKTIWIDIGVYPFIFCCRHSIELSLKVIIKNLIIIYKRKNNIKTRNDYICKLERVCKQHNIYSLYNELINFKDFKNELQEAFDNFGHFEDCIKDYFFDVDGDSFRYTYKRNLENINLSEIIIIDIGVLYWKYKKLMSFLDYMINQFSRQLNINYLQTYTQHLGRQKIEELSLDLKDLNKWSKTETIKNKNTLCLKYGISSTEFDKALKIIKSHYSFAVNIGLENKFKNLTEDFFRKIGEVYNMFIKKEAAKLKNSNIAIDITEIDKYSPLSEEYNNFCDKITKSLSADEKKIILTFYEVASRPMDGDYICEDIDYLFTTWEDNLDNDYVSEKIDYLISSKKLREALLMCGQTTYLKWFDKYIQYD